jgi:hypothetical protein
MHFKLDTRLIYIYIFVTQDMKADKPLAKALISFVTIGTESYIYDVVSPRATFLAAGMS